jgi:GTPase involved in cell partitioning and DNA repair
MTINLQIIIWGFLSGDGGIGAGCWLRDELEQKGGKNIGTEGEGRDNGT